MYIVFIVCYFVHSVFSPLGSVSPLAFLWHKSARLTHCLRWSQAEDMAVPIPQCPAFPSHTHIHEQTPHLTTATSLAPLQGFPSFHPVCWGTSGITSHIGLAPCLLPPSTVMRGVGPHPCSARLSAAPLSAQTSHRPSLFMTFSLWLLIQQNYIIFQT